MSESPFGLDLAQLRRSASLKWNAYPSDVLPAWVAEMDVAPCPPVVDAITDAMRRGDTGYPNLTAYQECMQRYFQDAWGLQVPVDRVRAVADVMTGICVNIELFTDVGGSVAIGTPVYPPFFMVNQLTRRRIIEAPLSPQGRLDFANLEAAFRSGAKVYVLCNPANPVGTVPTVQELATLAELAAQYRVRVISDEIHAPIVYDNTPFTPYLSVPGTESAVSVFSASKAWNLAAMKAAVMVFGSEAARHTTDWPLLVSSGCSHFGAVSQMAAVEHGRDWQGRVLTELQANRDLLASLVVQRLPKVRMQLPQATYLAWLDCRELGLGDDPAAAFLDVGKVAFNHGPTFGSPGNGFVRVNFATTPSLIEQMVDRMVHAVEETA